MSKAIRERMVPWVDPKLPREYFDIKYFIPFSRMIEYSLALNS